MTKLPVICFVSNSWKYCACLQRIMLNYMYNLCPLTQSTCLTNIGCSASEFVDGKLVSEAENGYLDLFFL